MRDSGNFIAGLRYLADSRLGLHACGDLSTTISHHRPVCTGRRWTRPEPEYGKLSTGYLTFITVVPGSSAQDYCLQRPTVPAAYRMPLGCWLIVLSSESGQRLGRLQYCFAAGRGYCLGEGMPSRLVPIL